MKWRQDVCGQIFIPAYKDEPEAIVQATHEPLISVELFNEVQDALNGRKRKFPSKNTLKEELPLRGFLECRKCGAKLTGSASKGNGGRYFFTIVRKDVMSVLKRRKPIRLLLRKLKGLQMIQRVLICLKRSYPAMLKKIKRQSLTGFRKSKKR